MAGARPRRGFTLTELMVALALSTIVLAGVSQLVGSLFRSEQVTQWRTRGDTEPQEAIDILDPLLRRAGEGLPVDSTFAGLSVAGTGDTIYVLTAVPGDSVRNGLSCNGPFGAPSAGCVIVSQTAASEFSGQDSLFVLTSPLGRSYLTRKRAGSSITADCCRVTIPFDTLSVLGFPRAGAAAVMGDNNITLRRARLIRIYRSGSEIYVDDPATRAAGLPPWPLLLRVTAFSNQLLFLTPNNTGTRPSMSGVQLYRNITGVRIDYTINAIFGDNTTRVLQRTIFISPSALAQ
ncbi:MAG: prepilin-type N-terminal cleavage/methylation domain-containing protein [Gemmatimonadaceae bacterium]